MQKRNIWSKLTSSSIAVQHEWIKQNPIPRVLRKALKLFEKLPNTKAHLESIMLTYQLKKNMLSHN